MTGRILIADGLATNRIMLKVRLSAACHDVLTAETTEQVMALAMRERPDLIILGASLTGDDPVALCRRLRQDAATATVPLLVQCDAARQIEALRAGATAALDPRIDEQMLLARIRSLLREREFLGAMPGMAEAAAGFEAPLRGTVTLVADTPSRALGWKHLLSQRLPLNFTVNDAEQALAAAARNKPAELYVIASDLEHQGEGLRLLAELRSRTGSRDASFIMAVPQGRSDIATIALDLGAGDTMPLALQTDAAVEATAITITAQIRRKRQTDRYRAEAERHRVWAMTDSLTGLYNRRYALPRLTAIAQEAQEQGAPFSILAMDLDRFKQVNDRFGHAAGDAVLVEIAARIDAALPESVLVARVGGEEFVAVLPQTDADEAMGMAETVRQAVMAEPVILPERVGGGDLQVTLSIGIATGCPVEGRCAEPLRVAEDAMDQADRAMLEAKSLGRNRVIRASALRTAWQWPQSASRAGVSGR
ncbi:diguanylate cyclase [Paracoccus zhejiangensis]|uniref:diguanylate cyclase n=1 Tax=Paracoccus zhejiangensis TaxID=1077935 RepID=A0A2H5EVE1_9RHOB|nr:diguanylate cyclase [Paracoccus zhejiangensis]AUH63262.1 diguanylate cyclase response regulator [Paracoccus zhejiangensis]